MLLLYLLVFPTSITLNFLSTYKLEYLKQTPSLISGLEQHHFKQVTNSHTGAHLTCLCPVYSLHKCWDCHGNSCLLLSFLWTRQKVKCYVESSLSVTESLVWLLWIFSSLLAPFIVVIIYWLLSFMCSSLFFSTLSVSAASLLLYFWPILILLLFTFWAPPFLLFKNSFLMR